MQYAIVSGIWTPNTAHLIDRMQANVPITWCQRKFPEAVISQTTPKGSWICAVCWAAQQVSR